MTTTNELNGIKLFAHTDRGNKAYASACITDDHGVDDICSYIAREVIDKTHAKPKFRSSTITVESPYGKGEDYETWVRLSFAKVRPYGYTLSPDMGALTHHTHAEVRKALTDMLTDAVHRLADKTRGEQAMAA